MIKTKSRRGATTAQLRDAIDRGKTSSKVSHPDPAAASRRRGRRKQPKPRARREGVAPRIRTRRTTRTAMVLASRVATPKHCLLPAAAHASRNLKVQSGFIPCPLRSSTGFQSRAGACARFMVQCRIASNSFGDHHWPEHLLKHEPSRRRFDTARCRRRNSLPGFPRVTPPSDGHTGLSVCRRVDVRASAFSRSNRVSAA